MKSKKVTQPRQPSKPQLKLPTLTDPHLAALLMFIDDRHGDDDEGSLSAEYARVLAHQLSPHRRVWRMPRRAEFQGTG
jgi:hypothetical protein